MPGNVQNRGPATFKTTDELAALYRRGDLRGLTQFTTRLLGALPVRRAQRTTAAAAAAPTPVTGFNAVSAPSLDWRVAFTRPRTVPAPPPSATTIPAELIVAYTFDDPASSRNFVRAINENRDVPLDPQGNAFRGAGADPGGEIADHWCPGSATTAAFGHRSDVRKTVDADALTAHGLRGKGVNVVIVDQGLDKAHIPTANWGGGLDHYIDNTLVQKAGTAPRTSHGMMIARSILDLAPQAKLYDMPMISATAPPNIPVFVSSAYAAFSNLMQVIRDRRKTQPWSGPWVLVNAWGIYDTALDPAGSYTENKELNGHPLINLLTQAVDDDCLDVIFAAGNCGAYCPSQRCGDRDRGPGHSIWGANAHPKVLTVGAVRADATWIGYSSQGPAPALLQPEKPDLCAPSNFRENLDAMTLNSGTSAACAVAAGVIAALRSGDKCGQDDVPPAAMKDALMKSARKLAGGSATWDSRLGHGIINAEAARQALPH